MEKENVQKNEKKRIYLLDIIRGVLIIYVVYYHFMYDLNDILGNDIPYLYSGWFSGIRDAMSGSLIFISGISCHFSRNNLKRGIRTIAIAMVLTAATYFVMPSQTILFGILHLLGTMMTLYGVAEIIFRRVANPYSKGKMKLRLCLAAIFLILFALCKDIYYGRVGIGKMSFKLPKALYGSFPMYLLGFRGPYSSADYYPLIPWGFLFLAGSMVGYYFKKEDMPSFLYRNFCRPLAFIGRHTMIIYLVHQPLFLGIFMILDKLK